MSEHVRRRLELGVRSLVRTEGVFALCGLLPEFQPRLVISRPLSGCTGRLLFG